MFKTSKKRALATPLALILTLAVFASLLVFPSAQAETPATTVGKVTELNFNTDKAVGASDGQRADFFVGSAHFELAAPVEGTFGFDPENGAVYAVKAADEVHGSFGTRWFIYTEDANKALNGADYNYVKIRLKTSVPLNATTTIALRDANSDWAYYGAVAAPATTTEWTEVVIDLNANHGLTPARSIHTAETLGVGNTFVFEVLDQEWSNDPNYANLAVYLSKITFYEKEEDIYRKVINFDTDKAVGAPDGQRADFFVGSAHFELAAPVEGTFGFDPDNGAVYAVKAADEVHGSFGTRFYIYTEDANKALNGADYNYVKIRLKTSVPLNATTTIGLRDMGAGNWGYYGAVAAPATTTEWTDIVIDLNADSGLSPVCPIGTVSALGVGNSFVLEILDQDWSNDPNYANLAVYLSKITFYSADYSTLNAAIAAAEAKNEADYTATSWAAMQTALADAKAALASEFKSEIAAAAAALNDAVAALAAKPNFAALNAAISTANGLNKDDYSEDSWADVETALAAAQAALTSESQTEVDDVAAALNAALAALGNTVALNAKIAEAEAKELSDYTSATATALTDALANAYAVLDNGGDQNAIDAALATLTAAIEGLVAMPNAETLEAAIAAAEALTATDYTSATWAVVAEKLEDAKATLASESQDEVDAAAKALTDAIDALVKMPTLDALNAAIAAAEALAEEVYTEATWADMQAALAAAKAVLTSESQTEVDDAAAALNAAVEALERVPVADILKIDFTSPNAVKGAVEDSELANIYLGKVTYDLGLGGTEGLISFDEKTGLATTKKDSATDEALACGIRMFFYAKDAANLINGTDYNFLKVRFKANHPITDTTIVAIRDAATHWHYYGAAYKLNKVGDWYEALIDLNANHMESPMGSIKDAVLGEGDTFCVEFLDVGSFGANREWADSYGDGLEISLESLTFFANEDDAKDSLTAPDTGMGADYTALLVCLMVLSAMAVIVVASKRKKTR